MASGFVCGTTKSACYAGITSPNAGLLNPTSPALSALVRVLRHIENGQIVGTQPLAPAQQPPASAYVFSDAAIAAIETWMARGSPNN
jgi:hypothetical protein